MAVLLVGELVARADPQRVAELYASCYTGDGWANPETFVQFRSVLLGMVPTHRLAQEGMAVEVRAKQSDGVTYYSADGVDHEGKRWALDLSPWSDWLALEVVDSTGHSLSIDELATHVYYEITWGGWPEQNAARAQELKSGIAAIKAELGLEEETEE